MRSLIRLNLCLRRTYSPRIEGGIGLLPRCCLSPSRGLHSSTIGPDTTLPANIPEAKQTPATASIQKLFSLKKRTVVVTGAGRGLGITLAKAIAEAGGDVICLDVLAEPQKKEWDAVEAMCEASNSRPTYLQCDITDEKAVESILNKAIGGSDKGTRPLQGLVHCAGIQQMIDAIDYPVQDFRRILEVNVMGSFIVAKHTARLMRDTGSTGSIVLVASMSGQIANRVGSKT